MGVSVFCFSDLFLLQVIKCGPVRHCRGLGIQVKNGI